MKELEFLDQNQFKISDFSIPEYQTLYDIKIISTPFMFGDGDMLSFYAYKKEDNILIFSDLGNLWWEKIASNSLNYDENYKKDEIQKILNYFGVYKDRNVFMKKIDQPKIYAPEYEFFRYIQCLICLITLLSI
jgi:hypothetical protein